MWWSAVARSDVVGDVSDEGQDRQDGLNSPIGEPRQWPSSTHGAHEVGCGAATSGHSEGCGGVRWCWPTVRPEMWKVRSRTCRPPRQRSAIDGQRRGKVWTVHGPAGRASRSCLNRAR